VSTMSRPLLATSSRRVLTGALALLFLFPLVWAAVASVAPQPGTAQVDGWGLGNYARLAGYQAGLTQYLINSVLISGMTVIFTLVVSLLGGYAFALFNFPGKNLLFLATLAILMVPYATLLIPLYVLLNSIGLQNSLVGLALVLTMFQLPFATFMMRISFEAVPLPLAVANIRGQVMGVVDYGATEAGVVILALPCVVLFLILQRHYVRGFMSGALKG
jgi:multiple sugar transport system permease protein